MMTDKPTATDGHLDWNDLAQLADEGPDGTAPSVLAHLADCAACQAAWAEAVRYRGARLLGMTERVPEDLAAQAREVFRPGAQGGASVGSADQATPRTWRPVPVLALGGTLLAAVLALFILLPRAPRHDKSDLDHSLIRSALVAQSVAGMVFPGISGQDDRGQPAYRAGSAADQSLAGIVNQMYEVWQHGPQGPDDTWWLAAGYAAVGRLGLASDLIHQALRRYPDNVRLLHLDAITAWQLSEFERSEHALDRILDLAPADATALFNLALIQIETDRPAEAISALRQLVRTGENPALQQRSRELLTEIESPHR